MCGFYVNHFSNCLILLTLFSKRNQANKNQSYRHKRRATRVENGRARALHGCR